MKLLILFFLRNDIVIERTNRARLQYRHLSRFSSQSARPGYKIIAISEMNGESIRPPPPSVATGPSVGTAAEFKGTRGSIFHTSLALIVWLGSVHFNALIVLASFVFLPFTKALLFVSPSLFCCLNLRFLVWRFTSKNVGMLCCYCVSGSLDC